MKLTNLTKTALASGLAFSLLTGCESKPATIKEGSFRGFPAKVKTEYGKSFFFNVFHFGDERFLEIKDTVRDFSLRAYDNNNDGAWDKISIDQRAPKENPLRQYFSKDSVDAAYKEISGQ